MITKEQELTLEQLPDADWVIADRFRIDYPGSIASDVKDSIYCALEIENAHPILGYKRIRRFLIMHANGIISYVSGYDGLYRPKTEYNIGIDRAKFHIKQTFTFNKFK